MSAPERVQGGLRLAVDHSLCSGTGHCREIAPEAFQLRDGWSWPADDLDLATADHDSLRQAEASCPWFAITLTQPTE